MACVSVLTLLCGHTQIPLIPHSSDHHRAENAEHRRAGNGVLRLSERVRTTSEQIAGMWNSDKMRSRCDSSPNSIAAASRSAKTLMQQQQHSATETAGQGGVILFWPRIFPSSTDFQLHDAIFSAVAEISFHRLQRLSVRRQRHQVSLSVNWTTWQPGAQPRSPTAGPRCAPEPFHGQLSPQ